MNLKYIILLLSFLVSTSYSFSQVVSFGNVQTTIDSGTMELPVLAGDSFLEVSGYQLGIRLTGQGYELLGIKGYGIFINSSQLYDTNNVSTLWFEPQGELVSKNQGDTIAIITVRKAFTLFGGVYEIDFMDELMVTISSI